MKHAKKIFLVLFLTISSKLLLAGEADLVLPDLNSVVFHGINGRALLIGGLLLCVAGMLFGLFQYLQIKKIKIHSSMGDVSEL
ncbi:MAG: hypothetical protein WC838_06675, partial [Candidatus Margulisiibacteriota bacterium]